MPINEKNPLPIDQNSMDDNQLKEFYLDPNTHLEPLKQTYVRPTIMSQETKNRLENILKNEQLTDNQIQKRIDIMAALKIKNIIIEV